LHAYHMVHWYAATDMQGGACARMWIIDTVLECRSTGGTKGKRGYRFRYRSTRPGSRVAVEKMGLGRGLLWKRWGRDRGVAVGTMRPE
jgi:hypothetical protein